MDETTVDSSWEREAENWVRWVRRPGHDSYWYFREAFFDELVPPPGRQTLEMGCGEGRVARDLVARKHRVIGIDSSPTLIRYAREADPSGRYELADAASLPFADASFDLVIAYNSLMDIADMPRAVREAARVLQQGGRFCVSVTHPVNDAGRFESDEPTAAFIIRGSYFGRRPFEGHFERDGLQMTFRGWMYALEDYCRALESAGFLVERVREPAASDDAVDKQPGYRRWQRVPLFLQLRAVKR
ncbi:MAG: class I SAM-dependent methyltransferase [Chloroflexi bacterium]|nr:MAG: class I SAM-dependent methyltransferase [Chloroflexota bacterium]